MTLKEGVSLIGLKIEMRRVMKLSEEFCKKMNLKQSIITSGTEGEHMAGSYHYFGWALDYRVFYLGLNEQQEYAKFMSNQLGGQYTVILHEGHHMHIQYNGG